MPDTLRPDDPRLVIRVSSASRMLDCSRAHLYNLIAAGKIASVKIGDSRRIPRSEVERLARHGLVGGEGGNDAPAA